MGAFFGDRDWGRLLTAMVTPFGSTGEVNHFEVARIAEYLVDVQKNDGIVVNGTTGESPTLTHDEKFGLLQAVLDAVGDRAAVLFGAGTNNTAESVGLVEEAERAGAHGIMAVNPYYNRPGQEGLFAHFSALAGCTKLPVMLYNIQSRSAINLETTTLLRLAEHPNIVAVKEASANLPQISEVCASVPKGFRVYSGDDGLTLPVLSLGGHGVVSVTAHVLGRQIKQMIDIFDSDPAGARCIHHRLSAATRALFQAPSPVPIKYALSQLGFDCERVRLPLVPLSEFQKEDVRMALQGAA